MSIIQDALKKIQGETENRVSAGGDSDGYELRGYDFTYREKRPFALPILAVILLAAVSFYMIKNLYQNIIAAHPLKNISSSAEKNPVPENRDEGSELVSQPALNDAEAGVETVLRQARRRPDDDKVTEQVFMLSGIMMLNNTPRAIINGSVLETGDSISGAVVEDIGKEQVLLRYNSERVLLKLR